MLKATLPPEPNRDRSCLFGDQAYWPGFRTLLRPRARHHRQSQCEVARCKGRRDCGEAPAWFLESPKYIIRCWDEIHRLATGSALNCLTRLPACLIYHAIRLLKLFASIDEVMGRRPRRRGVTFPDGTPENTWPCSPIFPPAGALASDGARLDMPGRKLELDGLSGEFCSAGTLHGIATPLHQMAS